MNSDIIIGLIGSFIWFLIGYIFNKLFHFIKNIRPIKKLWSIKDPKNLIIVASTSTETDTGEYFRPATGIGQLRALGYSIESLSKAYDVIIQNILLSNDQVQKQIEKDIIILGGPKNNIITRLFLEKIYEINNIATQNINTIKWIDNGEVKEYNGIKKIKKLLKIMV